MSENETEEAPPAPETTRQQDGKWLPGVSGNPTGRPKGARHKATLAVEALLDGEAEALTRKAIDAALAGDVTALRLCLDRIIPIRRDRSVTFSLPQLATPTDAVAAASAVVTAVAEGELTPLEAAELAKVIGAFVSAVELHDLEQRIAALEAERK
jgi:hypothetical protein